MRVDEEKKELIATGEWLKRIKREGFGDELLFVPSELALLGVAPKDVVPRLDWLKEQKRDTVQVSTEPTGTEDQVPEEVITEEQEVVPEEQPEPQEDALPYSEFGPWEWFDRLDEEVEESMRLIFAETDPETPDFNELALLTKRRTRGKLARASVSKSIELVSAVSE